MPPFCASGRRESALLCIPAVKSPITREKRGAASAGGIMMALLYRYWACSALGSGSAGYFFITSVHKESLSCQTLVLLKLTKAKTPTAKTTALQANVFLGTKYFSRSTPAIKDRPIYGT